MKPNKPLRTLTAFAGIGYVITTTMIPRVSEVFIKVGLKGRDMSKKPPVAEIPESMGIVVAVTYLTLMLALIPFVFFKYLVNFASMSNDEEVSETYLQQYNTLSHNHLFPHNKLAEYLSAVLCLQSTTLLGLFDDLFDIRWRDKFFLPSIASLPLLIVYYVDFSVTSIVVPSFITESQWGSLLLANVEFLIRWGNIVVSRITGLTFSTLAPDYYIKTAIKVPKMLDLGVFYYLYMSAVSIFSPNSINILAGVNGLEVGQLIVLGIILLLNDSCYLFSNSISQAARDSHLFSALFIIPFIGVSLGLLQYNWFPAKVFVGDTYCYFSGMVFAIVGILGHFSKTLMIFLLPQIINFVYSVPQLFHIVPCPRHRLPKFDVEDGLMYPSYGEVTTTGGSALQRIMFNTLEVFGLISLKRDKNGDITHFSNMTIINLILVRLGPLREDALCMVILLLQLITGISMIAFRHTVGPWLFGYDNLTWGVK
ncbi:tunicamycin resistance protein [Scheffersomyces spartinae]|uniref:UDP-N-acetylglucosamine--dolichyl-phosphate N-acetylglucosaminephosphotransferase n=1 Tax=Scheffersomyces spartinae TaxID=45513 RepID=A0A9P8AL42_9ASCO|nr:tunicamycin resistance protein [Scheffersomyces spartinae]KAG7195709.1 tunicamycin resistance protein [Scheffersomyces spartinae]